MADTITEIEFYTVNQGIAIPYEKRGPFDRPAIMDVLPTERQSKMLIEYAEQNGVKLKDLLPPSRW